MRVAARIAVRTRPRGGVPMRPHGGAGQATPRRATRRRATAARGTPASRRPATARLLAAARLLVVRGPRRAPVRIGRCAAQSQAQPCLQRRAVRKPGLLARTVQAAVGSTGNPRPYSPLREAARGRLRPHQPRPPPAMGHSPAGPPPAPRTRRGCRARRPPCRTADRGPAGPDRSTPPGPRTTVRPPPGRDSPAAPRPTDVPCRKNLPRRARRRRPGHGRTTPATRRRAWPSPVSHQARTAPPRSRPVRLRMAGGVAPSAATRRDRASLTRSTRPASSPRGIVPLRAPRGLVQPVGQAVPPRPRRSPGTQPSR
jgi:hypothetical protein